MAEVRRRLAAAFLDGGHAVGMARVRRDRALDPVAPEARLAVDDAAILLLDEAVLPLQPQRLHRDRRLGDDHHAGGVAVEPVPKVWVPMMVARLWS